MESIKELKYQIDLIDYLCSDEYILTKQTTDYIRVQTEQNKQNEPEDTREPDSYYPLCFY